MYVCMYIYVCVGVYVYVWVCTLINIYVDDGVSLVIKIIIPAFTPNSIPNLCKFFLCRRREIQF